MGGAAGPDFTPHRNGEREMTQTLEGRPVVGRTLERRGPAHQRGSAGPAMSASLTAVGGHRGEAATP
jgi:hypothetical protein